MSSQQSMDGSRRRHPSFISSLRPNFAHPSEEVFAHLLDRYGYSWRYEPIEFPLAWGENGAPVKGFRPDFFLPEQKLFIELTVLEQRLVTKKNQKIRQFRFLYPEVELVVVYQRDFAGLLEQHNLGTINDLAA